MKSRMEKIAEGISLTFLRNLDTRLDLAGRRGTLEQDFRNRWACDGNRYPINHARDIVAGLVVLDAADQANAWRTAVDDKIATCFERAQDKFVAGDHLQGTEILADAVRASLGNIASSFGWPHADDDDLYRAAASLATGSTFPSDDENLYVLLEGATDEGFDLCSAFGAVMGRPDALRYGLYDEATFRAQHDAAQFARMAISIAHSLATAKAVAT